MNTPIQRFRRLLRVDRKDITQVYVYALFNGVVNLSLPLGIQAIVNLIQGGEVSTSWMILVAFVIGGIALTGILQLLQLRIVENIAQKIFSRASFEFAYRIPNIQYGALHNYYAPELANRFFDTMTIQKGLPKILIDFSLALFQIVVGLLLLSFYHSFFIIFSFLLLILICLIFLLTGPVGLRTSLQESKFKYKIAFWLEEIARTKLSFKLVANSDLNLQTSDYHVNNYLDSREQHFRVLIRQGLYLIGFKVIIAAGLLITGSILVFNEQMNIGQFVAAEIIIILIISSVEKLIKSMDSIYDVLTALEKIGYVTDMPLDSDEGMDLGSFEQGIDISIDSVRFQHQDSAEDTLCGLSLDIPAEESVFITGPSSAGKSTLLQLLSRVIDPKSGVIRFNGLPAKSLSLEALRSHIGYALSNNDIFQGTVMENITMNRPEATAENIKLAIEITGLDKYLSTAPMGLKTLLDPEGSTIPRNIKNRIILARAIVTMPTRLILEDPLDHVNHEEKEEIIRKLTSAGRPWKIVVTSVDMLWKKYTDRTYNIQQGVIV